MKDSWALLYKRDPNITRVLSELSLPNNLHSAVLFWGQKKFASKEKFHKSTVCYTIWYCLAILVEEIHLYLWMATACLLCEEGRERKLIPPLFSGSTKNIAAFWNKYTFSIGQIKYFPRFTCGR